MGLLSKIFSNTRKPEGFFGRMMVNGMNGGGHARMAEWGLSHLTLTADANVLDVGCGGGANVARLLKRCPKGTVTGIDYSPVSVKKSTEVNAAAIAAGRCHILEGSAAALHFEEGVFDLVSPSCDMRLRPWSKSVELCHKYGVKCYPSIDMPSFEKHLKQVFKNPTKHLGIYR